MKAESTTGLVATIGEVDKGQNFGDEWMLMAENGTNKNSVSHQSYVAVEPCQLLVILKDQFKEHFGESEWQAKWEPAAKWKKMPPKEAFVEHYGLRRWKQHWDWQHNDEDEVLATSRAKRTSRRTPGR